MDRTRLIRLIHVGRRQLSLDDDTYRAVVQAVSGDNRTSCRDLNISELQAVLDRMKESGFKPVAKNKGRRPNPIKGRQKLIGKIEAILADQKLPWAYVDGMARHMFGIEKTDWLDADQLRRIVAALEIHRRRMT